MSENESGKRGVIVARIAIVLNSSWNIVNFRLSLLKRLEETGHEIVAIAPRDDYTDSIPYPFYPVEIESRSTNPVGELKTIWHLFGTIRRAKVDLLLLYTIKPNVYGSIIAAFLKIPSIANIAGLGNLFVKKRAVTLMAMMLYRFALRFPKRVFFQNEDDLNVFLRNRLVDQRKAMRIPGSGVDLMRFRCQEEAGQKRGNGKFVFLLVSRMLWDKGIYEYVEAAKRILKNRPNVVFQLLGFLNVDNPQAITTEDMDKIASTGGIEYLGISDRVEKIMARADCVVLPTKYKEGVPRTLLEAAALCKPMIATDVPGCRDVVEDAVTGYLCTPGDVDDLYLAMEKMLLLDDSARAEMGKKGRAKVEQNFDQEIVIQHYLDAVEVALSSK